jgi:succinyl-CoA synthetase beta subunit
MKLLEYEAKQLLKRGDIAIPQGVIIKKEDVLPLITLPTVLKSQVPTGGRGKAGGVIMIKSISEFHLSIPTLFDLPIKGLLPTSILAEEKLSIEREYYVSLLIDRANSTIHLVAHPDGGMEVELNHLDNFFNMEINRDNLENAAQKLANFLRHNIQDITPFLTNIFEIFISSDALLLEINPLIFTSDGRLVCGDCKMELDDSAAFRHPEWNFEHTTSDRNFVVLDPNGTIATIANGAGLAMATVDAVAARGMTPANFLDIGGGATTESVYEALNKFQEFPCLEAIIINIFAGITRCDQIAQAIIEASEKIPTLPPLFIRLAGTNFEEAVALLTTTGIQTLGTLEDCLDAAKEVVHE